MVRPTGICDSCFAEMPVNSDNLCDRCVSSINEDEKRWIENRSYHVRHKWFVHYNDKFTKYDNFKDAWMEFSRLSENVGDDWSSVPLFGRVTHFSDFCPDIAGYKISSVD